MLPSMPVARGSITCDNIDISAQQDGPMHKRLTSSDIEYDRIVLPCEVGRALARALPQANEKPVKLVSLRHLALSLCRQEDELLCCSLHSVERWA